MNVNGVISRLQIKYPGKNIVKNDINNPTEIICEIDPTSEHPDHNVAIVVLDKSKPHYHEKSTEIYEVLQGKLMVNKNGKEFILNIGEEIVINPTEKHFARGNETWFKVTSTPGWTLEDHILINE